MSSTQVEIFPTVAASVPVDAAWDEAFLRVESYLRAHHVESRVLLNQLANEIIRDAHAWAIENPGVEPISAAMRAMHARIGAWFARAGNAGDWSDERVRARGRLSLVLANLPSSWASSFLSTRPVPPELAAALASGVLRPGPELRFRNMLPAPLEFGFEEGGDSNPQKKIGWLMMRAAAWWLPLVGLFVFAWAASH